MADAEGLRFGTKAVERGLITQAQFARALEKAATLQKPVSEVCVAEGLLTRDQVREIHSQAPVVPGYEIIKDLGQGGMGAVFKVKQLSMDRIVALKILKRELAEDADYVKRFLLEARMAARLDHPNIVRALDCGEANGEHYLVMEYIEGAPLDQILTQRRMLSEPEALKVVRQVALGLQHAWQHQVVHRDIKPQNIMFAKEGVAKILDLGLCRDVRSNVHLTATGSVHGTPAFMSPEQARGDKDIDTRTDIYSMGVMLYQLLTGVLPFSGETIGALLLQHMSDKPVPPIQRNPAISPEANDLVLAMMEKDRDRRPKDPGEVAKRIEAILKGQKRRPAAAPRKLGPLAIGAGALLVAACLFYLFSGKPREPAAHPSANPAPSRPPAAPAPTPQSGKVLLVVTSHGDLGRGQQTGCWLSEVAVPYRTLIDAKLEVEFASPKGGEAPVDPRSTGHFESQQFMHSADMEKLRTTRKLSGLDPSAYSAVVFLGGDGAFFDFPNDPDVARIARGVWEEGGIVASICRGTAALLNVKLANGHYLIEGQTVTGFAATPGGPLPVDLISEIRRRGGTPDSGQGWQSHVVLSGGGRLLTAENPPSAGDFARRLVELLRPH